MAAISTRNGSFRPPFAPDNQKGPRSRQRGFINPGRNQRASFIHTPM